MTTLRRFGDKAQRLLALDTEQLLNDCFLRPDQLLKKEMFDLFWQSNLQDYLRIKSSKTSVETFIIRLFDELQQVLDGNRKQNSTLLFGVARCSCLTSFPFLSFAEFPIESIFRTLVFLAAFYPVKLNSINSSLHPFLDGKSKASYMAKCEGLEEVGESSQNQSHKSLLLSAVKIRKDLFFFTPVLFLFAFLFISPFAPFLSDSLFLCFVFIA